MLQIAKKKYAPSMAEFMVAMAK